MPSFEGKVIAITGGASGIGLALATILHNRGAKISMADISQSGLDAASISMSGAEDIIAYKCDVQDLFQIRAWLQYTVQHFGKIDGAANMAGVSRKFQLVEDQDDEDWDRVIGIKLKCYKGLMYCLKEEVKLLLPGSSIVNAASIAGLRGLNQSAAYCASKHGVVGITKACAKDYGPRGIRINAVAPGYTMTPMLEAASQGVEDQVELHAGSLPLGRKATAEEVARVVVFLLSDESAYITGCVHSVDGGWTAG